MYLLPRAISYMFGTAGSVDCVREGISLFEEFWERRGQRSQWYIQQRALAPTCTRGNSERIAGSLTHPALLLVPTYNAACFRDWLLGLWPYRCWRRLFSPCLVTALRFLQITSRIQLSTNASRHLKGSWAKWWAGVCLKYLPLIPGEMWCCWQQCERFYCFKKKVWCGHLWKFSCAYPTVTCHVVTAQYINTSFYHRWIDSPPWKGGGEAKRRSKGHWLQLITIWSLLIYNIMPTEYEILSYNMCV